MPDSNRFWITGLVPATFTPLHPDGSLNLAVVEPMVEHLIREGVTGLYVCGSTGEGVSLAREERMAATEAFVAAARHRVPVVVQVGHNSIAEARLLAAHAQSAGAEAISATPPSYFKPPTLAALVDYHGRDCRRRARPALLLLSYSRHDRRDAQRGGVPARWQRQNSQPRRRQVQPHGRLRPAGSAGGRRRAATTCSLAATRCC